MALSVRELFHSTLIVGAESFCDASPGGWSAERCDDGATLLLTRAGVYARLAGGQESIADAGTALLFRGGEPYRIRHPLARTTGDRCTILRLSAPLFDEVFGGVRHDHGAIRLATGAQLRHSAALTLWRDPSASDRLAGEELALGLLGAVRHEFDSDGAARSSPGAQRLIARVQGRLAAAPEQAHDLAALAAEVAVSPFHLCRLFRRETGLTVRQYRLRLRLAVALERLTEGQDDLASLAVELGFSHHSHLTAVFRQQFGAPPRVVREELRGVRLRRARTFLTAPPAPPHYL
jgi:AraC-like DNA-binding protein